MVFLGFMFVCYLITTRRLASGGISGGLRHMYASFGQQTAEGGNHQEEVARQIQIYVAYHAYLQGNINAFDRAFAASQANMANVYLGHSVAWMEWIARWSDACFT